MHFRGRGLSSCQTDVVDVALDIEKKLPEKRPKRTPKPFHSESAEQETLNSPDEAFRREFFLPIVDTALRSLSDRCAKMEGVYALYSFLFSMGNMRQMIRGGGGKTAREVKKP
ncbi:hypothetical protein ATANTOWER_018433 [Ataeniobius toweri]|uniref:Uncharacterized protein n=1 Tax=Ataeniobius toweri TaxID=208326 RepID=A0ABU7B887_9TELE|nr:hypothetical protein [Ataeniobius toweri]